MNSQLSVAPIYIRREPGYSKSGLSLDEWWGCVVLYHNSCKVAAWLILEKWVLGVFSDLYHTLIQLTVSVILIIFSVPLSHSLTLLLWLIPPLFFVSSTSSFLPL